jgi:hypothetical protein
MGLILPIAAAAAIALFAGQAKALPSTPVYV